MDNLSNLDLLVGQSFLSKKYYYSLFLCREKGETLRNFQNKVDKIILP